MPTISIKKIILWIVIITVLVKWDEIMAVILSIFFVFYRAFEPLRESPPLARYTAALAVLALLYISVFKLLQSMRKSKYRK